MMDELIIKGTQNTPGIILKPEGFIRFDGRGLSEQCDDLFEQVLEWMTGFLKDPPEITTVIIALEYLNSMSSKILVSILKEVCRLTDAGKQFFVHWCYEDGDEDILERGEFIASSLNIPIDFIRSKNIKYCCKSIC
jgi:hypothetical protein